MSRSAAHGLLSIIIPKTQTGGDGQRSTLCYPGACPLRSDPSGRPIPRDMDQGKGKNRLLFGRGPPKPYIAVVGGPKAIRVDEKFMVGQRVLAHGVHAGRKNKPAGDQCGVSNRTTLIRLSRRVGAKQVEIKDHPGRRKLPGGINDGEAMTAKRRTKPAGRNCWLDTPSRLDPAAVPSVWSIAGRFKAIPMGTRNSARIDTSISTAPAKFYRRCSGQRRPARGHAVSRW